VTHSLDDDARAALARLDELGRRRGARVVEGSGPIVRVDGREMIDASSNDYLGIAGHPALKQAAREALEDGVGARASRLVTGNHRWLVNLEHALADWLHADGVCVFASGYAANVGTISALFGEGDVIFSDALNHASIIDGCRLSRAEVVVFPHRDVAALERAMRERSGRRRVVVSETLFSMDGDVADVVALRDLCERHDASLLLDEAHAVGAHGPNGRGIAASRNVVPEVLVGTFGKALGAAGAFVATTHSIAELLWNQARTLVFSTAPPAAVVAAALAAVELVCGSEGESRRASLEMNVRHLRKRAPHLRGEHAIAPLLVGADCEAVAMATRTFERGVLTVAIRPPTVPDGSARLRVSISSTHSFAMIDRIGVALDGA
jgi:8-amino-7-oxononanoate synthase